jgi:peptide/nickel transport system substrate-binding protein
MPATKRVVAICTALITVVAWTLAACGVASEVDVPLTIVPTRTPVLSVFDPTEEPPPPKTLVVCLNQEPASLYLYSDAFLYGDMEKEANAILNAVYDGPYDLVNYEIKPVILEQIPDLTRGVDALLQEVSVLENEVYLNPTTLQPELLRVGKPYLPSGCEESTCIQTFQGGEVSMQRLVVDFHLKKDLTWSDGEPLTAADSVFSYELDRHPDTPTTKYLVDRTSSYQALEDELSVRWTGIPGFLDKEYATNFWSPLPEHVLEAYAPIDLLSAPEANTSIVGWGPYIIVEWQAGNQVLLESNPRYFRASEGLPKFERLIFRFLGGDINSAVQQVLTGECDILDESLIPYEAQKALLELQSDGLLQFHAAPGAEIVRLDFNLAPVDGRTSGSLFADSRTRRAIAACIDRQRIIDELLFGMSEAPDTYVSPIHPAFYDGLEPIQFDISKASTLLEEVGWQDTDENSETPRIAVGVPDVLLEAPLSFTYLTAPGVAQEAVAQQIQADLAACGVEMTLEYQDAELIQAPWPDGSAFGRRFDVVGWSWPDWISPLCEMFASREIPSEEYPFGSNASGFNNPNYNEACDIILLGQPESQKYKTAIRQTQEIFTSELPAIPLYLQPRVVVTANEVCGIEVAPLTFSLLWNLETFDIGENCGR